MESPRAAQYISDLRANVDSRLSELVERKGPSRLYEAVQYILESPGKRIRPVLVLLSSDLFSSNRVDSIHAALGVEVLHAFTLVHDDMVDRSNLRRGRKTVHLKWDEATALLVGDYLHGMAVRLFSMVTVDILPRVLHVYSNTFSTLCEGQIEDLELEKNAHATVAEYLSMIEKKTGALLSASMRLGGICGRAHEEDLGLLDRIGWHLGRAFQIQDDLLDITATDNRWGKPVGSDLVSGKKTMLLLEAVSRAEGVDRAFFDMVIERGGMSTDAVDDAREIMDRIGVLEGAKSSVIFHTDEALVLCKKLPAGDASEALQFLIQGLQSRLH